MTWAVWTTASAPPRRSNRAGFEYRTSGAIQWNAVNAVTASNAARPGSHSLEVGDDDLRSGKRREVAARDGGEPLAELDADEFEPARRERDAGLPVPVRSRGSGLPAGFPPG